MHDYRLLPFKEDRESAVDTTAVVDKACLNTSLQHDSNE